VLLVVVDVNFDHDASLGNTWDWKGIREKLEEIQSTETLIKIMRFVVEISAGIFILEVMHFCHGTEM
jgi:hypothetical protein